MENQNVTPNPASATVTPKEKKEDYGQHIKSLSNRALKKEVIRQGKRNMREMNYHGAILATVLDIVMDGFIQGKEMYPR